MRWNWQQPDWPRFHYEPEALAPLETEFLKRGGVVIGSVMHLSDDDQSNLRVEVISTEALKTSEIEGAVLDRESVQASIRQQFGLVTDRRRIAPSDQGIAEMMVDLYRTFAAPIGHASLFRWHEMVMRGRRDAPVMGRYREHGDPMQIVSGPAHAPKVHFEAPPSAQVPREMDAFCAWFNETRPGGLRPLPALARAGIAHLYFESIHPFEDGNGRIGRAIAERALAQGLGQPSLTALSALIERRRSHYYRALELAHNTNHVGDWLHWFGPMVLDAQRHTQSWIDFLIAKTRLLDSVRGVLNARQEKALLRMMREGPDGFEGGLSAGKYSAITSAPAATARRDLAALVACGALVRTGERKGTRYWLPFAVGSKAETRFRH